MIYLENYDSPIGEIILGSDGRHMIGLWIGPQKNDSYILKNCSCTYSHVPVFDMAKNWLDIYFKGECPDFTPPVAFPYGSDFRREVWQLLLDIPYGELTTYGALAKKMAEKLGRPAMSAQAIGGAVGHNPISVIVPCHRVIGAGGNLTGYGGGLDIKEKLLQIEHFDMSRFHRPKV